jgi:hypothetical protein
MTTDAAFDAKDLESKVKAMYRSVAENPTGEFHFEMGRALAERLGYHPTDLDQIPPRPLSPSPVSATTSIWPSCRPAKLS